MKLLHFFVRDSSFNVQFINELVIRISQHSNNEAQNAAEIRFVHCRTILRLRVTQLGNEIFLKSVVFIASRTSDCTVAKDRKANPDHAFTSSA